MLDFTMEVKKNEFSAIGRRTALLLSLVVRKTAFDIEAWAKAGAPVDTGAGRASIHVVTDNKNGYTQAVTDAKGLDPKAELAPEVGPTQKLEAVVAVAALHMVYVEFGTIRMPAQPFFTPAIERARPIFKKAIAAAMRQGAGS